MKADANLCLKVQNISELCRRAVMVFSYIHDVSDSLQPKKLLFDYISKLIRHKAA